MKSSYVMKWKQYRNAHILVSGLVLVGDVRLLGLPELDVGGLRLGSAVSCCMVAESDCS